MIVSYIKKTWHSENTNPLEPLFIFYTIMLYMRNIDHYIIVKKNKQHSNFQI